MTFALGPNRRGGTLASVIAIFALGFAVGALFKAAPERALTAEKILTAVARGGETGPATTMRSLAAYPADVIRVIDGDTFEARVRVWPGLDVETKVRLRNIDAPELHARCADELAKAQAARVALQSMLAAGGVTISQVGLDKYGGRIDAVVATRDIADISAALLNAGFARRYSGGRRASWC